jgi:threonine/homoserine/homoserine lactone efflux protein
MKLETWLLFVITEAVLSMTPGPAVLYVFSQALRRGPGKSVWASGGILSANAAYFVLSAASLGAVFVASYRLFFAIKWAGAAYLIYLGIQSLRSRHSAMALPETNSPQSSGWRILRDGFFLQGANPKALLFFTAILPQFIDPRQSVPYQVLVLGLSSILVEFIILFVYGQLAGRVSAAARNPRFEVLTDRIAGCLLIAAGMGLARLRQT